MRRLGVRWLAILGLAVACGGGSGGPGADAVPEASPDLADAADAADAADDADAADAADAPADAPVDTYTKPFPPEVPGPPAATFDCTADLSKLPGHVSPVPLDCMVDPACHERMVLGHRAAGGDLGVIAPENSLSALRAAIVMGLDGVEMDVRDTKDGRFIMMHDSDVSRTTDGKGDASQMTLDEIRALHLKTDYLKSGGDFGCEKVPTFEEVLDTAKGRLWIDLDTKTDRLAELIQLIVDRDMLDQVFISAGGTGKAVAARAVNPKVRVWVWLGSMEEVEAAATVVTPPPDVFEVKMAFAPAAAALVHPLGAKLSFDAFNMDGLYYADEDPKIYTDVYDAGIDNLESEFPTQVLQVLGRWTF